MMCSVGCVCTDKKLQPQDKQEDMEGVFLNCHC